MNAPAGASFRVEKRRDWAGGSGGILKGKSHTMQHIEL
jgi:hypothetical protein